MAARKVVPIASGDENGRMAWESKTIDRCIWRGAIEIGGGQLGGILLFVNPAFKRSWSFKLLLHDVEVLRWDARPTKAGHSNPPAGCPEGFPGKVRGREHEHIWTPGLDCRCARNLDDTMDVSTHERMFVSFCARASVLCEVAYTPPEPPLALAL
jgi:hypothetical protein